MTEDTDPLADADSGEKRTFTHEVDVSVWDGAPSEWLGDDRRPRDIRATDIRIEGDRGSERVVYELEADIQKADQREIPAFQTQESYNEWQQWRQERKSNTAPTPTWLRRAVSLAVTMGSVGVALLVARRVMTAADISINGQQIAGPSPVTLALVAVTFVVVWLAVMYAPGKVMAQ